MCLEACLRESGRAAQGEVEQAGGPRLAGLTLNRMQS